MLVTSIPFFFNHISEKLVFLNVIYDCEVKRQQASTSNNKQVQQASTHRVIVKAHEICTTLYNTRTEK